MPQSSGIAVFGVRMPAFMNEESLGKSRKRAEHTQPSGFYRRAFFKHPIVWSFELLQHRLQEEWSKSEYASM